MRPMMKAILFLLAFAGLVVLIQCCGCYSINTETFSRIVPHIHNIAGLNAEVELRGASHTLHIPFIYWKIDESAPFTFELRIWSEASVEGSVSFTAATVNTSNGQSFTLLNEREPRIILNLQKRAVFNSSSSGFITNYVYETRYTFKPLPIQFREGLKCDLHIEGMINPFGISFTLRQEFEGTRSRERGSILKAYSNI